MDMLDKKGEAIMELEKAIEEGDGTLIDYSSLGKKYLISGQDFKRVEEYCENECMGIKFLMNANFLRELVSSLFAAGFKPPFSNDDFESRKFSSHLKQNGIMESMEKKFGTDNVELVSKIVVKSTYNFLHKI